MTRQTVLGLAGKTQKLKHLEEATPISLQPDWALGLVLGQLAGYGSGTDTHADERHSMVATVWRDKPGMGRCILDTSNVVAVAELAVGAVGAVVGFVVHAVVVVDFVVFGVHAGVVVLVVLAVAVEVDVVLLQELSWLLLLWSR